LGTAAAITSTTWSALIPRVVGEDLLAEAVSAQQSLSILVLVGAPAAGGLLAGAFGTGLPVTIDAATFVVVTFAAALVRTRRTPGRAPAGDGSSRVRGGFAVLCADRVLAPLLAGVALVLLLVGMVDVVLVFLVRDTLHAGGIWYGVTEASWMAGMVAGALGAGRAALACAGVAAFAVAPTVAILVPLSVLGGIGNGYAGACLSTLLTARTPDGARGRVSAAAGAIFGGAQGASLFLGGAVAIVLSPRAIYAAGGSLGLAAAGLLAFTEASSADDVSGRRRLRLQPVLRVRRDQTAADPAEPGQQDDVADEHDQVAALREAGDVDDRAAGNAGGGPGGCESR